MSTRPLQNRCHPDGHLEAVGARGTLMGNRGGRIHRADKTLGKSRWASPAWIACRLSFRDRQREVWSNSYTEVFFLDEATALAAGHRPCFECRRSDALDFANAWARAQGETKRARAPDMDRILHSARRAPPAWHDPATLPDGAMIGGSAPALVFRGKAHPWTWTGYGAPRDLPPDRVPVLTPDAILGVLRQGYAPMLHPTLQTDADTEQG